MTGILKAATHNFVQKLDSNVGNKSMYLRMYKVI